jgi:Plavaka transposase
MFTFMDALPKGPKWHCTTIHTDSYITTHPVNLIWHDALEVMQHIFGNAVFANDMEFDPYEIQVNREREYGEWMSCQQVHDIQAYIIFLILCNVPNNG